MFKLLRKKGQSAIEYAIMFVAIVVAILVMQTWVKRAVQGRLRSSGDDIGEQFGSGTTYNFLTNRDIITNETSSSLTNRYTLNYQTDRTTRTGRETIPVPSVEAWSW